MKKLFLILLIFASCSVEQHTISVSIDYVYYAPYNGPVPVTAIMITDKSTWTFDLINHPTGGGKSRTIEIPRDDYKMLSVVFYDEEGSPTHRVMERPTPDGQGMQPTSWVGETHPLHYDQVILWNVIPYNR